MPKTFLSKASTRTRLNRQVRAVAAGGHRGSPALKKLSAQFAAFAGSPERGNRCGGRESPERTGKLRQASMIGAKKVGA
jgi:hypothetical protein